MGIGASQAGFEEATYRELEAVLQPDRLTIHIETFESAMLQLGKFESQSADLRNAAHSMISQAGMFGFVHLSDLCRDLEYDVECDRDVSILQASIRSAISLAQSKIAELQLKKRRSTG